jgi:hypothetical protein
MSREEFKVAAATLCLFVAVTVSAIVACVGAANSQSRLPPASDAHTAYSAPGLYANGSQALPASATQVFTAPAAGFTRVRIKLINYDNTIAIWCRWGTVGGAPAAVAGIGSFLLPAGGGIDDQGAGVNQSALNCIAASGTPNLYAEQY